MEVWEDGNYVKFPAKLVQSMGKHLHVLDFKCKTAISDDLFRNKVLA